MSTLRQLTAEEVRDAMRLIGDCRDVGRQPAMWNLRVACYFQIKLRAVFTTGFSCRYDNGEVTACDLYCSCWADNRLHHRWQKFVENHGCRRYPSVQKFSEYYSGRAITLTRRELIPDSAWKKSEERTHRNEVEQDDLILSGHPMVSGITHMFSINRRAGDKPFNSRDKALETLIHEELGRLFGTRLGLSLSASAPPTDLPPRLHSVLLLLLGGESNKEMASRLGLSPNTVHEYVLNLYRRFDVRSRHELFTLAFQEGWLPGEFSEPPK